eukprot:TRINITY_DN1174_c0_g2_i1.p1 TRINITY_DN1174_c0_g2~~TRINITY_DN1174_c0_g2_i1.p1  ORF type:complete len:585 (-),score=110.15 TRINITY_DN1174_c0_g2_i1:442-2169(-)
MSAVDEQVGGWASMPAEILLECLRHLSVWDLSSASGVCTAWHRIGSREEVWRNLCLEWSADLSESFGVDVEGEVWRVLRHLSNHDGMQLTQSMANEYENCRDFFRRELYPLRPSHSFMDLMRNGGDGRGMSSEFKKKWKVHRDEKMSSKEKISTAAQISAACAGSPVIAAPLLALGAGLLVGSQAREAKGALLDGKEWRLPEWHCGHPHGFGSELQWTTWGAAALLASPVLVPVGIVGLGASGVAAVARPVVHRCAPIKGAVAAPINHLRRKRREYRSAPLKAQAELLGREEEPFVCPSMFGVRAAWMPPLEGNMHLVAFKIFDNDYANSLETEAYATSSLTGYSAGTCPPVHVVLRQPEEDVAPEEWKVIGGSETMYVNMRVKNDILSRVVFVLMRDKGGHLTRGPKVQHALMELFPVAGIVEVNNPTAELTDEERCEILRVVEECTQEGAEQAREAIQHGQARSATSSIEGSGNAEPVAGGGETEGAEAAESEAAARARAKPAMFARYLLPSTEEYKWWHYVMGSVVRRRDGSWEWEPMREACMDELSIADVRKRLVQQAKDGQLCSGKELYT